MFWASLVFIIRKNNEVLVLKRSSNRGAHRGKWGLPGGKADLKEMPEETAIRESFEETGIKIREDKLFFLSKFSKGERDYYFFWTKEENPEVIIDEEHEGWDWISLENLESVIEVPTPKFIFNLLRSNLMQSTD